MDPSICVIDNYHANNCLATWSELSPRTTKLLEIKVLLAFLKVTVKEAWQCKFGMKACDLLNGIMLFLKVSVIEYY